MIFWKVWFPTNAKNAEVKGYMKFIHIAILPFSISLIPVAAALGTGGYTLSIFPVHLDFCQPRNLDILFYAFILPFCINQPAASTFNLLTLYKVLKLKQQLIKKVANLEIIDQIHSHYPLIAGRQPKSRMQAFSFLFYFAFALAMSLILYTNGLRNTFQYQQGFNDYFMCEAFGSNLSP